MHDIPHTCPPLCNHIEAPPVARACGAYATRTSMRSKGARTAISKCREPCESTRKCRLYSVQPGRYSNPVFTHDAIP
eukprot:3831750-Pyramimonas_sp.AAC.1